MVEAPPLRSHRRSPLGRWPIVAVGAAALVLAALLVVSPHPTGMMVAALLSVLGAGVALAFARRRSPSAGDTPRIDSPPAQAPPFAAILEALPDPILLIAGRDADDPADRRF